MRKRKELKVIGRMETIDFPELDIYNIKAKVDTGAYTSSLHCTNIRLEEKNEQKILCFMVFTEGNEEGSLKERCFENFSKKRIKNSFGQIEWRFIIKTKIRLFDQDLAIEISLADRTKMRYPVLLGRKLMHKKFLVDVSRKNLNKKALD